ncbi:MAG: hypothetical protein DBY32_01325 [Phascolarctobacterium sp.]|nr:MAG: hypothetical protein DBY32_01325 [Phascolarctobacterium sp.]
MTVIDATLPKKDRILIAAEEVFSRRGYANATLDEIIKLADTGKGTLYKYFGNKDNLFYTLVETKSRPLVEELKTAANSDKDIKTKLFNYMVTLIRFLCANKGLWRILWYELNAANQGMHPTLGANGQWQIKSFYNTGLPQKEEERLLRYYQILLDEVMVLAFILEEGIKSGFIKDIDTPLPIKNGVNYSGLSPESIFGAFHMFAGLAISVFHIIDDSAQAEEIANIAIDRFLYGRAARKI